MKLTARQREGISIIEPKGKITIGKGDIALRDAVQEALKAGSNNILINLKKATRIDSSGMGELICAYTSVTNRGGKLKLLNLPANIQDVLGITQLITVFEVFDDEEEALASYR